MVVRCSMASALNWWRQGLSEPGGSSTTDLFLPMNFAATTAPDMLLVPGSKQLETSDFFCRAAAFIQDGSEIPQAAGPASSGFSKATLLRTDYHETTSILQMIYTSQNGSSYKHGASGHDLGHGTQHTR